MPELDQELKEKRTSIEGLVVSPPKINNETDGNGVRVGLSLDKLQDIPSDSDSSGSSSNSSSSTCGSDSEMDSDSDPMKPGEESPCEDIVKP